MTKSKIAALLATLALGAFAAGCSTATNENMNKPANTTPPTNTSKPPANLAPPANSNTGAKPPANANKMPPPPKPSATKKP